MIRFDIVTVFPELIEKYCTTSIIGRARKQGQVIIRVHDLRNWTTDKHRTVDDRVFGGGPGMLLKVEPLLKAITELRKQAKADGFEAKVLATVASGELFTQDTAKQFATSNHDTAYIILCGHYEGFDARIYDFIDQQLTVGPYILTGGELPALIMVDAVTRLLPGVLGNELSAAEETSFKFEEGQLTVENEHPQYTTPASFSYTDTDNMTHTLEVPEILRSGHHKKIEEENKSRRHKKVLISGK